MSSATELVARRELLWNLTLRELRGRYKRSVLGWGWSLLNPIAFMFVYTFAFSIILRANPQAGDPSGNTSYPFYLMSALLPWTFFNVSVTTSMGALVTNGPLVRKVAFPREHLVISTVIAGLFTLAIEMVVLAAAFVIGGYPRVLQWMPMVALMSILLGVFSAGFGLALAAANVYFRDVSYLWGIVIQAWFYSTPVVYPPRYVEQRLGGHPHLLQLYNDMPMAVCVTIFRNLMFDLRMPSMGDVGLFALYAVVAFAFGWWIFDRFEGRFAEEL